MKIFNMPRRSGKTSQLVKNVDGLQCFGLINIAIVAPTWTHLSIINHKLDDMCINKEGLKFYVVGLNHCPITRLYNLVCSSEQIDYMLVDEYQECNYVLLNMIKEQFSDKLSMWGTE